MLPDKTKSQRIDWIDCLKGFGMICVVLGHLAPFFPIEKLIYSFHMPLFFFLSGLVTKEKTTLFTTIKKSTSYIFIPFLIWDILSFIVSLVLMNDDTLTCIYRALFLNGLHSWNAPIWFLLVLFLIKIIYAFLHQVHIPNWIILLCMLVASLFVSHMNTLPFMINLLPISMVFFLLGIESRKIFIENKWRALQDKTPIKIFVAGISFVSLIVFGLVLNIRISFTGAYFGNYLYFYLGASGGILFFCILFSQLPCLPILKRIGKDSMFIMCFQYWIFFIMDKISTSLLNISFWHYRNTLKAIAVTIVTIAICLLITFLFRKLSNKFPRTRFFITKLGILLV